MFFKKKIRNHRNFLAPCYNILLIFQEVTPWVIKYAIVQKLQFDNKLFESISYEMKMCLCNKNGTFFTI